MDIFESIINLFFPKKREYEMTLNKTISYWYSLLRLYSINDITSLLPYSNSDVRNLLWALKYTNDRQSAHIIAELLFQFLFEEIMEIEMIENKSIVLTNIPPSKDRNKKYGFNQMEKVLKCVEQKLNDEKDICVRYIPNCLKYNKGHIPQVSMKNKIERGKNMLNAFEVNNKIDLQDTVCFVIDDITTTGATLNEAKRAFYKAGAKDICLVAIAH